jgi:hypothetical protein
MKITHLKKNLKSVVRYLSKPNLKTEESLALRNWESFIDSKSLPNTTYKYPKGLWIVQSNIKGEDLFKMTSVLLGIYQNRLSYFQIEEFQVAEEILSKLMGGKAEILEIKDKKVRQNCLALFLCLKYGGIITSKGIERLKILPVAQYLKDGKLSQVQIFSLRQIGSQKELLQKVSLVPFLAQEKRDNGNIRYSGYCKGHPGPKGIKLKPLGWELIGEEDEQRLLDLHEEYYLLFLVKTHLERENLKINP